MKPERKYKFSWELLGDISLGRPNLGQTTRLEIYRLMQFTVRDIIEEQFGSDKADELFFQAGKLSGLEFYKNLLSDATDINDFILKLQNVLTEMKIGILRVESSDIEQGRLIVTISEDLDCSGLPELKYESCKYDEGFISGLLEGYTHKQFKVKEINCWCTGDRTCRFTAEMEK